MYDATLLPVQPPVALQLAERWAHEKPDVVFARFEDGSEWTWAQTLDIARRTAAGLQSLGVAQGDNLLSWLPNGPEALRVWFAANLLGIRSAPTRQLLRKLDTRVFALQAQREIEEVSSAVLC